MKFCTQCRSKLQDRTGCETCGARAFGAPHRVPTTVEYAPASDLPTFVFSYGNRALLGLVERERQARIPFSYVNGTVLEVQTREDAAHRVDIRLWSQQDDPKTRPRESIVGQESQPSIRSVVRLRLGGGAERSFVLTQVRFGVAAGSRITLIFPVQIERALHPVYDYAAIAAVDLTTNNLAWSTTHPEVYAVRGRLPEEQTEVFADSLASFLDGLCRRCLRLFAQHHGERRNRSYPEHLGVER